MTLNLSNIKNAEGYLDTADAAKVARKVLPSFFPGVKFSVTIDRFSMGTSLRVKWTDGPTERQVDDALTFLRGTEADFDAGEGSRQVRGSFVLNGHTVYTTCWLTVSRHYSPEFTERIAKRVARKNGIEVSNRPALSVVLSRDTEDSVYSERHRAVLTPEGHLVVFGYR